MNQPSFDANVRCPFYTTGDGGESWRSKEIQARFCDGEFGSCARFMVQQGAQDREPPRDLRPTDHERALAGMRQPTPRSMF